MIYEYGILLNIAYPKGNILQQSRCDGGHVTTGTTFCAIQRLPAWKDGGMAS